MKRLPPLGLLLLLITGLALTWALHSSTALRWGTEFASRRLAFTLETESLEGGLAGPIQARGLKLAIGNLVIEAETVDVDWWPGDLLRGRVNLKHVIAKELVIQGLPSSDETVAASDRAPDIALPGLPVRLDLKQIRIDGLSYIGAGQRLRLAEHVSGTARWDSGGLDVEVARLDRTDLSLSTSTLRIGGAAPYTLSGELAWRIPVLLPGEQTTELTGRSQIQGELARPETSSTLLQPLEATLALRADLSQPVTTLQGRIDAEGIKLANLQENWPARALTLHSDFSVNDREIDANGTLQWADLPTLDIALKTVLGENHLQLENLDIQSREMPGSLNATGRLVLSAGQASELDLSWNNLDLEMGTEKIRLRSGGKARITGSPDDYALDISSDSQLDEYPPVKLDATAAGNREGLVLSRLRANLMNGSADGDARLDWQQGLKADARIKATGLDTSTLLKDAQGTLDFETAAAIQVDASEYHLTVNLDYLGGQIGGERLSGRGALVVDPGRISLDALDLELGGGTISASGTLAGKLDLRARIQQFRVSGWLPGLEGTFAGELVLAGTLETPSVQGSLSVLQPAFERWRAEQLDVLLDLDISNQRLSKVHVNATGLHNGEQVLGAMQIEGEGVAGGHLLNLQLSGGALELDGQVQGAYQVESGWRGRINRLSVVSASYSPSPWILNSGGELTSDGAKTRIGELCLNQEQALVCLSADVAAGAGSMSLQVSRLPLARLNPLLGNNLELSGQLDGGARAQLDDLGHITGEIRLDLGESMANWVRSDGAVSTLHLTRASLTGNADEQGLTLQATLNLDQQDTLDLALNMQRSPGPAFAWPAQGQLALGLADLSVYGSLVPELGDLTGKLSARLALTGSLGEPQTSGQLILENMEAHLPELGTRISGVSLDLQASRQATLVKASALVGDGTAEIDGSFSLLQGEPEAKFRLTGENLTLLDNPKIFLQASPDLTLGLSGDLLRISGGLKVPAARIQPVNLANAVRSSPDAVVLDGDGKQPQNRGRIKVRTNVLVELGDKVKFDGYGLSANIAGNLRLRNMSGNLTTARGELNVLNGKYKLYGMELGVERGQLLFAGGPLDTPGLSIRASRSTDNVRVGVDVGGTLPEPTLSIFSSPAMPQSEIIAYLLTGKPMVDMDTASQQNASAMGDAFALAGGNLLTGEIGARMGLDELSLRSNGEIGEEELVLGKYLSPDLYVSYGIGLYEAINTVRVRYQLNERLSVRTEYGVAQSIDLFWSAER